MSAAIRTIILNLDCRRRASVCWALGRALTHPWLRATMFSVTRSNCYLSVLLMVTDGGDKRVLFSLGISSDYFVFILWVG